MCGACRGIFFTVLSLITTGAICACSILLLLYMNKHNFQDVSKVFYIIVIVASVASTVLVLYALYASICGRSSARITLGIIYLIFAGLLVLCGILMLVKQDDMLVQFQKVFDKSDKEPFKGIVAYIQTEFNCIGFNDLLENSCKTKMKDFLSKWGKIIGFGSLALSVVLIIGAIVGFHYACCRHIDVDDDTSAKHRQLKTIEQPLTYGW